MLSRHAARAGASGFPVRHRRLSTPATAAGKGFASSKPSPKAGGDASKASLKRAAAEAAGKPRPRPINEAEAASGRVDYVAIKDWARGEAGDIGELQLAPGSPLPASGGADASGGGEAFWAQLGRHAQYLESQGATFLAGPRKAFLPFESWTYSLARYSAHLADLAAVHAALEAALTTAAAATAAAASATATAQGTAGSEPHAALARFGQGSGLWRAQAARADLAALLARHQAHGQASSEPQASPDAAAYAAYLQQLGRQAAAAAPSSSGGRGGGSGGGSSSVGSEEAAQACKAAARLLAHAYALQAQQQCLGTRIGAAATDALDLLPAGAASLYRDYPPTVQEPLQQLIAATDEAGRLLGQASRQAVLDELPRALRKSGLLIAPLATP